MPDFFVLGRRSVTPDEFIRVWSARYDYRNEHLYDDNIGKPLTRRRVIKLFEWKNGTPLSQAKRQTVEKHFAARIPEVKRLRAETGAEEFLDRFPQGGAIWRIYWLHLWKPDRFPIYDQHVHRAMTWIEDGIGSEIPTTDPAKIDAYIDRFIPFVEGVGRVDRRQLDRALCAVR